MYFRCIEKKTIELFLIGLFQQLIKCLSLMADFNVELWYIGLV